MIINSKLRQQFKTNNNEAQKLLNVMELALLTRASDETIRGSMKFIKIFFFDASQNEIEKALVSEKTINKK